MDRLFEFVANHWWLVGIWGAFLLALLWDNNRRSGLSVSTSQATMMANNEDAVFVDIRDAKDFSAGHIANAVNIPFATLTSRMSELDKYKDKPLILVCKSGQTVNMAGKTLREKGLHKRELNTRAR